MAKNLQIIDPRTARPDEVEDSTLRRVMERAVRRNQLSVWCDAPVWDIDRPDLLRALLQKFPSERLFYSYTPEPKYQERILDCFSPEIAIGYHSGISPYGQESVHRFVRCFSEHGRWFEWLFGAFEIRRMDEKDTLMRKGLLRTEDMDPTWKCADYSIYFNEEYGGISISCNKSDLFDDFLEFAGSIKWE